MNDTARCTVQFGETFSQHVNRCRCEIPAATWATMRHTDHLANLEPATGEGAVEEVADEIADALVDAHLSLLRLEWLTNQAQSGDLRSLEDQARIAFTAAALDRHLLDPDLLLIRAAESRTALWELLEHLGDIAPRDDAA